MPLRPASASDLLIDGKQVAGSGSTFDIVNPATEEIVGQAADATAEDVLATLVEVGFEEEAVHRPLDHITGPVVVGQVLSMEPETHSNGKTVNWCQVRVAPEASMTAVRLGSAWAMR